MDVVQKLLNERKQLYDIVKKNCVRPVIDTGHCDDCHDLHVGVQHYEDMTLNEPPKPENLHHIDDEWQNIEDSPTHPLTKPSVESESDNEQHQEEIEQESESISLEEESNQEQINNNVPLFL